MCVCGCPYTAHILATQWDILLSKTCIKGLYKTKQNMNNVECKYTKLTNQFRQERKCLN